MKQNLSPACSDRSLDRCGDDTSIHKEHKRHREMAIKYRDYVSSNKNKPINELANHVIEMGCSKERLAEILELKLADVESLLSGKVYPYIKNAWIASMHNPDDFSNHKLSYKEKGLTDSEKWDLFIKRNK